MTCQPNQERSAIIIRPMRDGELETLARIFTRAVHESAKSHYNPDQLRAWAPGDIPAFIARHNAYDAIIAEVDGEIAGFSDSRSDGYIDKLYVNPDFGRRGIAAALLAHIEALAREKGITRLHVRASLTARPIFEHAGFSVVEPLIVELAGQRFQTFILEKPL